MVDFLPVIQVMFIKYKIILIAKDKIHFSIMYFPLYVIYQHSQHLEKKKKGSPKVQEKKINVIFYQ